MHPGHNQTGSAMRWNPAPGWPAAPPGFVPPPGWAPDPTWPPAPEGWQLWVPIEPPKPRRALTIAVVVGVMVLVLFVVGAAGLAVRFAKSAFDENATTKFTTFVATDGTCEVRVPEDWSKADNIDGAGTIKIEDSGEKAFLQVVSESKADFADDMTAEGYGRLLADYLETSPTFSDVVITPFTTLEVNSLPAVQFEVEATVSGVKVHYLNTYVEGNSHFFQIVSWTSQSRFEESKQSLLEAAASFREK